jgi:hypothetical protein
MKASITGVIIGGLMLGFGIFLLAGTWVAYRYDMNIQSMGARSVGRVIQKRVVQGIEDGRDFGVAYWFLLPDGRKVNAERTIAKKQWERLRPGDDLEICYDAASPDRNFPLGSGNTSPGLILFTSVLGAAFAIGGAWFVIAAFIKTRTTRASSRFHAPA